MHEVHWDDAIEAVSAFVGRPVHLVVLHNDQPTGTDCRGTLTDAREVNGGLSLSIDGVAVVNLPHVQKLPNYSGQWGSVSKRSVRFGQSTGVTVHVSREDGE